MSVQGQAAGAERTRLPARHVQEPPSAKYLLFGAWVLFTEGAMALVFLPVLVFSSKANVPPGDIALFALIGVLCLVGGGLIYVSRPWSWWVALASAVVSAGYLLAVQGLTSSREAYVATALSSAAVVLLLVGKSAAGDTEALALASARLPFRLKVALVWAAIFFMLGLFLALSDLDFRFMAENFTYIAKGLEYTILLAVGAILLATFLALLGALGRLSHNPVAYGVSGFYTSFFRGTPLIVQLFLINLALPQIGVNLGRVSVVKFLALSAFVSGLIGLGLNYGAYMTEIFRAGIQSVGHGQAEAADALGMTYPQRMRRVVLPQATRVIIPPTGNEFIAMMKDTALVSFLGAEVARAELFLRAQLAFSEDLTKRLETLLMAAVLYWALTAIFTVFQVRIERRMAKGYVRVTAQTAIGGRRNQYLPAPAGDEQGDEQGGAEIAAPSGQPGILPTFEEPRP